jgi:hypothetical protein
VDTPVLSLHAMAGYARRRRCSCTSPSPTSSLSRC